MTCDLSLIQLWFLKAIKSSCNRYSESIKFIVELPSIPTTDSFERVINCSKRVYCKKKSQIFINLLEVINQGCANVVVSKLCQCEYLF